MIIQAATGNGVTYPTIKNYNDSSVGFTAEFVKTTVSEGESVVSSGNIDLDTLYDVRFSDRNLQEGFIQINGNQSIDSVKYETTSDKFYMVNNEVKRNQDGAGRVVVKSSRGSKSVEVEVGVGAGGNEFNQWAGFQDGTVCADAWSNISGLLTSSSPDLKLWDTNGWNTNCWAYSLRPYLQNIVAKRSSSGMAGGRARMKITPRHLFGAKHYAWGVGRNLTWLKSDGTEVSARIIGRNLHPEYDYAIYTLEEHDTDIDYARVLPNDHWQYINSSQSNVEWYRNSITKLAGWLPVLHTNYNENISLSFSARHGSDIELSDPVRSDIAGYAEEGRDILDLFTKQPINTFLPPPSYHPSSKDNTAYHYFQVVVGTSGNPVFTIINDKLVLLFSFFGPATGPAAGGNTAANNILNDMINKSDDDAIARGNLSSRTNLSITPIDLSNFTQIAS